MNESATKTVSISINPECIQQKLAINGYNAITRCTGPLIENAWYTEDIQLLFIKSGQLNLCHGNHDFQIVKHQIVLLKKNIWVECSAKSTIETEPVEYLQFTIKYDLIKEFFLASNIQATAHNVTLPVVINQSDARWLTYIDSLMPLFIEGTPSEPGLRKIKMLELVFLLMGIDKSLLHLLSGAKGFFRNSITATIEANISNPVSVEQLAVLSGKSVSSFRRDFMAIYNMPPSQWIRLKRLEKSRSLLQSTTMTITEICCMLGFESSAHFSRLFKSHYGYPPSGCKVNMLPA